MREEKFERANRKDGWRVKYGYGEDFRCSGGDQLYGGLQIRQSFGLGNVQADTGDQNREDDRSIMCFNYVRYEGPH